MKLCNIDLSIIIVNYNGKQHLENCLASIYEKTKGIKYEIFVSDNGSIDGSVNFLTKEYPDVHIIENKENLGFSKANNLAMRKSRGRYIAILNNDTILVNNALGLLVRFMDIHPDTGASGPKVLNKNMTLQPQCRRGFPTPLVAISRLAGLHKIFPRNKIFGHYFLTYINLEETHTVDSLSGACMVVRGETIKRVGGLDEDYFFYGEDLDWCYRIKEGGWNIYYYPEAQIIHLKGQSSKKILSSKLIYYMQNSYLIFYKKHYERKYPKFINAIVYLLVKTNLLFCLFINSVKRNFLR